MVQRDVGLPLAWGTVPAERLFLVKVGADPAAGAEAVLTVPGEEVWVPWSFTVSLVTSAVVANRRSVLLFDDGTTVFARRQGPAAIAANVTGNLSWTTDSDSSGASGAGDAISGSMPRLVLLPGFRMRTATLNLDAGDNYGAPVAYVQAFTLGGIARATERAERDFGGGF